VSVCGFSLTPGLARASLLCLIVTRLFAQTRSVVRDWGTRTFVAAQKRRNEAVDAIRPSQPAVPIAAPGLCRRAVSFGLPRPHGQLGLIQLELAGIIVAKGVQQVLHGHLFVFVFVHGGHGGHGGRGGHGGCSVL